MDINNILNNQQLVQNNITQGIDQTNNKFGNDFYLGQKVRSNSSFSLDNEDTMDNLLNNIGLEVQRRKGVD